MILVNLDPVEEFVVKRGDRIAQLVIQRVESPELRVVDALDDTDRGLGGLAPRAFEHEQTQPASTARHDGEAHAYATVEIA